LVADYADQPIQPRSIDPLKWWWGKKGWHVSTATPACAQIPLHFGDFGAVGRAVLQSRGAHKREAQQNFPRKC